MNDNYCRDKGGIEYVKCALCSSEENTPFPWGDYHLNLQDPFHVVRCKRCGMLYMSPRPDIVARRSLMRGLVPDVLRPYASATANYGAVTNNRLSVFLARISKLDSLVQKLDINPVKFLDIGASSGLLVRLAHETGWEAYGVEPSEDELLQAERTGNRLYNAVAEALPFADATFDIVHSHHVFEHLADPSRAIQEIWRVLKPGGLVFIEVPNQFDPLCQNG